MRTDPGAVVESTKGHTERFKSSRQDAFVQFERQLLYGDGSIKLFGVRIVTEERGSGGRTFTVTAKEGKAGQNESNLTLAGDVHLSASDGMTVRTQHATYTQSDGTVRTPGPVEFTSGRLSGTGVGMTYDQEHDMLSLLAEAVIHVAPDKTRAGGAEITSAKAEFARREKLLRFDENVTVRRAGQTIQADSAVGHLSDDEDHIDHVELHGHSHIEMSNASAGNLQGLTSSDMTLQYGADGQTLQHALLDGDSTIQLAGEKGTPGREIAAKTIDVSLAPDGTTPTALVARDTVQLTVPPETTVPGRIIRAAALDAKGEPGRGLTHAQFAGTVEFREHGAKIDRAANAATLDVGLKPGFTVEDAQFAHGVRFVEGKMTAVAALGRYDLEKGTLELSGSEPHAEVPHVDNDQIAIDGTTINVTLSGPKMQATGAPVKSVLQPPKKTGDKPADGDRKMPAMLKPDQAVTVLSASLDYDGTASKSSYTGDVRLFQGDTSIKAASIVLDDKSGDLTAGGGVTTTTVLQQTNKEKKKEGVHSVAKAQDLAYEDSIRRLTYTGEAHMIGPEGDMTAAKIELYLKPSGDEVERAEAYEKLTLREQHRTTTGNRMTYTAADEKYVVTGAPVETTDECGSVTTGHTLTFAKATDTIVVDGNNQIRTQTKGGGKCQ